MSRLRIQLSSTEIDAKIATNLDSAERSIMAALVECDTYARTKRGTPGYTRAQKVSRDLKKALGALSGVRRVRSIFDLEEEAPKLEAPARRDPKVAKAPEKRPA